MSGSVPTAREKESVSSVLAELRTTRPAYAPHVFLVDQSGSLVGQVPIEAVLSAPADVEIGNLRGDTPITVHPWDSAESVALSAVRRHDADVAVTDERGRLLGTIPIARLLAQLHDEHVDDILRLAGVAQSHPGPRDQHDLARAIRARLPWLVIGLAGGMIAAGVTSSFELALQHNVVLAFFIPLVVYMADAIGTQTETVLVRALAHGDVPASSQILREALVGLIIGLIVGLLAFVSLLLFRTDELVAVVIGLTLTTTACVATVVASLLPLGLARAGADPALAAGPVATVVQDVLSVAIYLGLAASLL
jgi:magnesium transporter